MPQIQKISRNNTAIYHQDDGCRQVFLHKTCIITAYPDRRVRFCSGGWNTATTTNRMNQVCNEWRLPFYVRRAGGALRIYCRTGVKLATLHGDEPVTLSPVFMPAPALAG